MNLLTTFMRDIYLDFMSQYFTLNFILNIILKVVLIIITFLAGHLFVIWSWRLINRILKKGNNRYLSEKKRKTLEVVFKSIIRYLIYFIVVIIILVIMEIPVASLLAGAGIVGLALAFGAQNLVNDLLHGFFILFEDQFGVGDFVKIGDLQGIVEEIGLRITVIKDFNGEQHIIPNGQINIVSNFSTGNIRVLVDVNISYEEDIENAISVMEQMCQEIAAQKQEEITEGPLVAGVQELASSSVVIRIMAYTRPMAQWQIARYIRKKTKETLNKAGIEIPYPHFVVQEKRRDIQSDREKI